ncbi:MAG: hypothetical protein A2180_13580 [Pseudomonadales bacterium GWC2_63_15]|nr:MAG: hypothetical protein A2180_13580 [Pseudomonadales bacterium GWC2_63_15]
MPPELRTQAEQAAKAAGRSLNAELVARIEASFISESETERLLPAKRARELSLMARAEIPNEIRRRAISAIGRAIRLGHSEAVASLEDLHLEIGIPDSELDDLTSKIIEELEGSGYRAKWDDITTLWIEF